MNVCIPERVSQAGCGALPRPHPRRRNTGVVSVATSFPKSTHRLIGGPSPLVPGLNYQYLRRYLWLPGPGCLSLRVPRVWSPLADAHISDLAAYSL